MTPFAHVNKPELVSLDPQGRWLLTSTHNVVRLWDLKTGLLDRALTPQFRELIPFSPYHAIDNSCVLQAGFSSDGSVIYAADSTGIFTWRRDALDQPQWTDVAATPRNAVSLGLMPPRLTIFEVVEPESVRYAVAPGGDV
jgi:WD40 repeat protein